MLPWNGLRHLGDSGNGGTTLEFLSPFLWRAPPVEMRRNTGNSFPTTQGKDPSSRAMRRKRDSSGYGRDTRAFSRGFPTRLSHEAFRQGCPTCHHGVSRSSARKSRQCRENRFPWNGLRHLGDSGNGGTTLEFLSPFLGRAPPLEMRQEHQEFFPDHPGKGSLLSN